MMNDTDDLYYAKQIGSIHEDTRLSTEEIYGEAIDYLLAILKDEGYERTVEAFKKLRPY